MKVSKFWSAFIDTAGDSLVFVFTVLGIGLGIVAIQVTKNPDITWKGILQTILTPRFVSSFFISLMSVANEERKGKGSPEAIAAKKSNLWSRIERAFFKSVGFVTSINMGS